MKLLILFFITTTFIAACDVTKSVTQQTVSQSDYRITDLNPWENTLAVIAPGENSNALLGKIVLSGGQNVAKHIFIKDLFLGQANATLDATLQYNHIALPTDINHAFGTDNQIVKLRDGSLLTMRSSCSWSPMSNPPDWASYSIEGGSCGTHAGQRGATLFWRSNDAGSNWTVQGVIDFGDENLRKYGLPRPRAANGKTDVAEDEQQVFPDGSKRWWIGGGDRPEIYVCPFTGNIYLTTRIQSGINNKTYLDNYLLFVSGDFGKTWKLITDQIPGWESLVMTSTGNGRLFLFNEVGSVPTLYYTSLPSTAKTTLSPGYEVYYEEKQNGANVNVLVAGPQKVWFDQPGVGNPSICRVTTTNAKTGAVLISYQSQNTSGNQEYKIINVSVKEDGAAPVVIPITTIRAEDPVNSSVMHGTFVEPDFVNTPSNVKQPTALFYWMDAPANPGGNFSVRYMLFQAAKYTTPKFLSLFNNNPRYITTLPGVGDYMKGAFFWNNGKYNYMAQWAETDGIHCNVVSVPPAFDIKK